MVKLQRNDWIGFPAIRSLAIAGLGLSFLCLFAAAPPDKGSDYIIRSDVPLVLLDLSVQDRSGGSVSGLSKENFRVLENGRPQPISVFMGEDVPVTVGILVDESFSMTPKRSETLTA